MTNQETLTEMASSAWANTKVAFRQPFFFPPNLNLLVYLIFRYIYPLYFLCIVLSSQSAFNTGKIASIFRRLFGISSQVSTAAMVSAKETAQAYINDNYVMVFSKTYCGYCERTKKLLEKKQKEIGFKYKVLELDTIGMKASCSGKLAVCWFCFSPIDEGDAIQDALEEMTSQRSVPNIYIKQKHIGGNSDIQARGSKLDEELKAAAEADSSISESSWMWLELSL